MGIVPCPLASQSDKESQSNPKHLKSQNSTTSLSSQPSLSSIPSLNFQSSQQQQPHHQCISTLKGHTSYVFSLALAGKHLYSGSSDKEIRLWSRNPWQHHHHHHQAHEPGPNNNVVAIGKGAVKSLVVSGDKLFSAHQDHKIRVWHHRKKYNLLATLPTVTDHFLKLFSPKNYVQVRRHKKCTWVHHVDAISALALSMDSSLLYSVSWDRTFKVWRTSDFKCLESVWDAHDDAVNALAVSGDGCVYTGSADKKIKVWRKIPGEKKHSLVDTLEKHKSGVNALAISADGSVLYSGACDRSIVVWEKGGSGEMVVVGALRGHSKPVLCLVVVEDLVCSGSADKTVRIWRRGGEKSYWCLAVLEGHRGPVKCLTAAADSSSSYIIYSGSLDCDIKVWQVSAP